VFSKWLKNGMLRGFNQGLTRILRGKNLTSRGKKLTCRGKNLTFFLVLGEKFDIQGEKFNMILYAYLQLKLNMNRLGGKI